MDYGATGAVIGHEISHSFDDQGALFDASGRLQNWWTTEDFAHFKAAGAQLAAQYDAYQPFPDIARQRQADAEREHRRRRRARRGLRRLPAVAAAARRRTASRGFTGEQQFFLSFAQSWRSKIREPALRQRIVTDGHAPGRVPRRHGAQPRRLVRRVRRASRARSCTSRPRIACGCGSAPALAQRSLSARARARFRFSTAAARSTRASHRERQRCRRAHDARTPVAGPR